MNTSMHTLQMLFRQLGLVDDADQIVAFIELHRPLPSDIALSKAYFWNDAQATFLAEAIEDDSDWCELVDKLDCLLRGK